MPTGIDSGNIPTGYTPDTGETGDTASDTASDTAETGDTWYPWDTGDTSVLSERWHIPVDTADDE